MPSLFSSGQFSVNLQLIYRQLLLSVMVSCAKWQLFVQPCFVITNYWLPLPTFVCSPAGLIKSFLERYNEQLSYYYYPAIHSTGGILSLLWLFHFFKCTVADFSAGALPIGMKFCMAVWPHLRQVFSYFGEDSPRDGRILGINNAPYGDICFLLKHL